MTAAVGFGLALALGSAAALNVSTQCCGSKEFRAATALCASFGSAHSNG